MIQFFSLLINNFESFPPIEIDSCIRIEMMILVYPISSPQKLEILHSKESLKVYIFKNDKIGITYLL